MEDSYVAARNFNNDVQELTDKELKDVKFDFDKIVTLDITRLNEQYQAKAFVYHSVKNFYVQIKRYDEQKKTYLCKPKLGEGGDDEKAQEDIEATQDELTDRIMVNIRILTEETTLSGNLQVGIHDKIANLSEYYSGKNKNSLVPIYKGELLKGDETFLKKFVKSGDNFILIAGSLEAKMWKRFPRMETGDYFYMSETYYDAVMFKPKKNIYFLGFGLL